MAWRKLIHRGLDGWVVQGKPGRHTPRTLSATLLLPKPLTHLALDQLIGHARRLHWAALDALSRLPLFRVTVIVRRSPTTRSFTFRPGGSMTCVFPSSTRKVSRISTSVPMRVVLTVMHPAPTA